jgi:IclR family pca regulon transcriptional regulator
VAVVDEDFRKSRDFVQSLERGLAVIRAFNGERQALSVSEAAEVTGLSRASIRRSLLTLVALGYVERSGRSFQLRPKVLELGYAYLSSLSLPEVALPHIERLVTEVNDSSEAAVLDGEEIVYILRVPGPRIVTTSVSVGGRMPAHATALGKILLASLDEAELDAFLSHSKLDSYTPATVTDPARLREELLTARERGWASTDQELEQGLRAVAVPIRGAGGKVIAALNVSSSIIVRTMESMQEELLPSLQLAARQIEADFTASTVSDPRRAISR